MQTVSRYRDLDHSKLEYPLMISGPGLINASDLPRTLPLQVLLPLEDLDAAANQGRAKDTVCYRFIESAHTLEHRRAA